MKLNMCELSLDLFSSYCAEASCSQYAQCTNGPDAAICTCGSGFQGYFLKKFEKFSDSYFSTFNIKVTERHVRISMSVRPMVLFVILLQIHQIVSTVLEATRVQPMLDLQI